MITAIIVALRFVLPALEAVALFIRCAVTTHEQVHVLKRFFVKEHYENALKASKKRWHLRKAKYSDGLERPIGDGLSGDILLYPANGGSAWSSKLVLIGEVIAGRGKGLTQYSHAAIVSDKPGHQFEATFPRTVESLIDATRPYQIWRIGNPRKDQRKAIIAWCHAHVGRWYNLIGVLTCGIIRLPGTYFCSEFAGFASKAGQIAVGDEQMTPNSIPDTPRARMVYEHWPPGMEHQQRGYRP